MYADTRTNRTLAHPENAPTCVPCAGSNAAFAHAFATRRLVFLPPVGTVPTPDAVFGGSNGRLWAFLLTSKRDTGETNNQIFIITCIK